MPLDEEVLSDSNKVSKNICATCGLPFKGYGNRIMKYCSRKCGGVGRSGKNHIESTCDFCKREILAYTKRRFCGKSCESNWNRSQMPVGKEWLEDKYLSEGLDANAIAKIVGRDGKTVWSWLKMHGIPTRPRGAYAMSNPNFTFWKTPGVDHPMKGKKMSAEVRQRASERCKAEGRVPYDPAIGSYMKGKRGPETPSWKGGVTPERQSFYSSKEWRDASKAVWRRDDATCQKCGKRNHEKQRYAFDVHHVVSFACVSLRADISNLILLCEDCHYWVHSSENVDKLFIKEATDAA
jgi:5-methylcytosine-specific restriction endonuclease McrA